MKNILVGQSGGPTAVLTEAFMALLKKDCDLKTMLATFTV